jgi:hypothetical protein
MGQENGHDDARARRTWLQMRLICLPNAPEIQQHKLSFLVVMHEKGNAKSQKRQLYWWLVQPGGGAGQKQVDLPAVGGKSHEHCGQGGRVESGGSQG